MPANSRALESNSLFVVSRLALRGDLAQFCASVRWPGWEQEVAALAPAHGISVCPFLWTAGPHVAARSRKATPLDELWRLECETAQGLKHMPQGSQIRVRITGGADDEPS
jgi:hypothetical protein